MSRKIGVKVLAVALVGSLLAGRGLCEDLASLTKRAKAKYATGIKDISIVLDVNVTPPGSEAIQSEVKLLAKGNKLRAETTMPIPGMAEVGNVKTTLVRDGSATWVIAAPLGRQMVAADIEKRCLPAWLWWELTDEDAEIAGADIIDNKTCYCIKLKEEEETVTKLWVEPVSLLVKKYETILASGEVITAVPTDVKKVTDGLELPHKIQVSVDGESVGTAEAKSIEVNKNLSDDLFDPAKVPVPSLNDAIKNLVQ